ncbi:TetR/AcrR family transcriptional regulator [Saccharopolyspora hirsuta]|uniref:TetR/AcrR family transcriptional regulator n=1 Tax=Saccharopolyspora hirsuta TaxID=1837 RepID=A0A5M7BMA8_SACHI|nr:TetR/AcrR family transcriptional regulator [Saccharopolyspora hirsuta]KAA5830100.1 TetR/AcrR family transcriptional regulator [Saccharopolyspora hirsuta]MBF6507451.1 TetR/AcrR family transcriptional regulator [Nocardia farcinica]
MAAEESVVRGPGRPRAGARPAPSEKEVLRRGMEAFAELGYDRTSARELAKRLGVSHNFINDRYGSKANFWRAVVDSALESDQRERQQLLEADLDDAERVRAVITHFYQAAVAAPLLGRVLADEFSRESERLDYLYENYVGPTLEPLVPAVERLMAAGRMPTVPVDVLFFAVISPVAALVQLPLAHRLGRPRPVTGESQARTARELADLIADRLLSRNPR